MLTTYQLPTDKTFPIDADELQLHELKQQLTTSNPTLFEDPLSEEIWRTTYKHHTDRTIDDTIFRVASSIASVEKTAALRYEWTAKFYDMLSQFKATCGGRIYANAGTDWTGTTLINCFVGPRASKDVDSLNSILTHLSNQANTLKSEGGWGENFSYIRPRGAMIHGIGVETPGAVKYMELFDKSSEIITSGSGKKSAGGKAKGKIRKGAQMAVLNCWHPDIIEFITAKQQPGRLTKFNVSVNCTDDFMNRITSINAINKNITAEQSKDNPDHQKIDALQEHKADLDKWVLRFPDTTHAEYGNLWTGDLSEWEGRGLPVVEYQTVSAMRLWNLIMESTYNRAEPGVLFLDRANYFNPLNYAETIHSTNPCGEQVLAPGGICCLSSLNLTQFVDPSVNGFDYEKLTKYTKYLVRFLDNVNTYSNVPLPQYKHNMEFKRRIGIGVLGWGSALYMLKTRFASKKAAQLQESMMRTIAVAAYEASIDLAIEKGMFKYCEPDLHADHVFVKSLGLSDSYMAKLRIHGIRNSSLLSIQPTGNTALAANVASGGGEPVFSPEYVRTMIVPQLPDHLVQVTPKWYEGAWHETELFKFTKEGDEEILRGVDSGVVYKIDKNRGLTKEVLCEDYGVRWLKARGEWDPAADWAVTALNLTVDDHVSDLKGFARWVDSAISKTINVPNEYPLSDFADIYLDAYNSGYIKGLTTYRTGTMTSVLSTVDGNSDTEEKETILSDVDLPESLPAVRKKLRAENKKWYLSVALLDGRPVEFFVQTNHHEKSATTHNAVERMIELARVKGIPERHITKVEEKIVSDNNVTKMARCISLLLRHGVLIKNVVAELDKVDNVYVGSFIFAIRKYLSSFIKDGEKVVGERCSECNSDNIVYQEGCRICMQCSSSKCS